METSGGYTPVEDVAVVCLQSLTDFSQQLHIFSVEVLTVMSILSVGACTCVRWHVGTCVYMHVEADIWCLPWSGSSWSLTEPRIPCFCLAMTLGFIRVLGVQIPVAAFPRQDFIH